MRKRTLLLVLALVFALCAAAPADEPEARRHDFPPVGKYQVLTGDFHMHTMYSDGKPTPKERAEESYRLGYDVICTSDHGNTRAYRVMNHVGSKLGLVVIRGLETGVAGNEHMNAIGVSSAYVPVDPHRWAKKPGEKTIYYQDAMKQIVDDGAFLIYNHPHCGYEGPVKWGVENKMVNGIEVKNEVVRNKWNTTEWNGIYCYPDAFDYALKNNLTMFANTDVHGQRSENPVMTLILANERSEEGVMDALRARRTAAWFENTVWGRESLLTDLVMATVRMSKTTDGKLALENKSPIKYRAKVDAIAEAVEVAPYATTDLGCTSPNPTVSVTWENVWTDPRTNLKTTYKL